MTAPKIKHRPVITVRVSNFQVVDSLKLETPDAERRWLGGEDVFADVSCDRLLEGSDAERKRRLIELLTADALGKELPAAN